MKKLVYVAGPLTISSEILHTRNAILAGQKIRDAGFVPIIPHLSILSEIVQPRDYEWWLKYDFDFDLLEHCHLMVRLPGKSSGADREDIFAREHNIPVYYSVDELIEKETPEL
jgi:hypothetical protein